MTDPFPRPPLALDDNLVGHTCPLCQQSFLAGERPTLAGQPPSVVHWTCHEAVRLVAMAKARQVGAEMVARAYQSGARKALEQFAWADQHGTRFVGVAGMTLADALDALNTSVQDFVGTDPVSGG